MQTMRISGGSLLRWLIMWPVPPSYGGRVIVVLLLTVAGIAIARAHSLPPVAAMAALATVLTFGAPAIYARLRRPARY